MPASSSTSGRWGESLSEKPAKNENRFGWLIPVGVTTVWFGVVAWYLSLPFEKGGERLYWFAKIAALDPDNFGDFLSGAFAPVAFFWLAYSVWIQRIELLETRLVLKEQEKAQNESAKASRELAQSNKEQFTLNTDQFALKLFYDYTELIYSMCEFKNCVTFVIGEKEKSRFEGKPHKNVYFIESKLSGNIRNLNSTKKDFFDFKFFLNSLKKITEIIEDENSIQEENWTSINFIAELKEIFLRFSEISKMSERVGETMKNFYGTHNILEEIQKIETRWNSAIIKKKRESQPNESSPP